MPVPIKFRLINNLSKGVDISFGDCYALGIQFLVPREELHPQEYNIAGAIFWLGPLVLFNMEVTKGRVAFGVLNSVVSYIWEC